MPQLIVRHIEQDLIVKLEKRAAQHGVSVEEEHRRILQKALLGKPEQKLSFKECLLQMPNVGEDIDFARQPDFGRAVDL